MHVGVEHALHMLAGQHPALAHPLDIALGADHAVAVVAGERRQREIVGDAPRLVGGQPARVEDGR